MCCVTVFRQGPARNDRFCKVMVNFPGASDHDENHSFVSLSVRIVQAMASVSLSFGSTTHD